MLELDELLHELRVELFLLFRESTLGALALADLPLLDARELRVALLFERSHHRIDPKTEPLALIVHPSLDAQRGLLDGALEFFARRRAERTLRLRGRGGRLDDARGLDSRGLLDLRLDVFGDVETVGVFEGGTHRDL